MPTVFASNLIPPLQRNPRVALAAHVRRSWPFGRAGRTRSTAGKTIAAKGVLRTERGYLVCFAGHGGVSVFGLLGSVGRSEG